jgi:hypothetical protein
LPLKKTSNLRWNWISYNSLLNEEGMKNCRVVKEKPLPEQKFSFLLEQLAQAGELGALPNNKEQG